MIINTEHLKEKVAKYFKQKSEMVKGMNNNQRKMFLFILETEQIEAEKAIRVIEALAEKFNNEVV